MKPTQPNAVTTVAQSLPSATPNLTDWHTWTALLTSIAALITVIFHKDLSVYIPVISIAAAGLTNIILMLTKHSYAAALVAASNATTTAAVVAPPGVVSEITKASQIMHAVQQIQSTASPIETAVQNMGPATTARSQTPAVG